MNRNRPLTVLNLLSILCLVALLVGCGQPGVPTALTRQMEVYTHNHNELVIIGPADPVNIAVSRYNNTTDHQPLGRLIMRIENLSNLALVNNPIGNLPPPLGNHAKEPITSLFSDAQRPSVVVRVYEHLDPISTLPDHVVELSNLESGVYAEPNWNIKTPDGADPNEINKDPNACADPHSGGESPFGDSMSLNVPASAFEEQWAFKTIGIPPTDDNSTEQRVVVALFDSAPYKDFDGIKKFYLPDGSPINIEDSIRKFSKNNPTPSSTPTPTSTPTPNSKNPNIADHGFFEAGLIHKIAPNATIYLFRVFDDYGCADLGLVGIAMLDALKELVFKGEGQLVINASFGALIHPNEDIITPKGKKLPHGIALFQMILDEARRNNIIIVAAAGNNSAPAATGHPTPQAQPMQYPANYASVIGVAASTLDNQRSCFSNQGDVAAPGGNGLRNNGKPCGPGIRLWQFLPTPCPTDMAQCPYTIIGPAPTTISHTEYIGWSGSSFSTAIVTGMVALVIQKVKDHHNLQQRVFCMIEEGAQPVQGSASAQGTQQAPGSESDLGAGIVNIGKTLNAETDCRLKFP